MSAASAALKTILTEARVPEEICELVYGMGMITVADFGNLFSAEEANDGLQEHFLDKVEAHKTNILTRSRLRTAWQCANQQTAAAVTRIGAPTPQQDLDTPLDPEVEAEVARK